MIQIASDIKRRVYDAIMAQENPIGTYGQGQSYDDLNEVDFLKLIWDLPSMASEDGRFRNAEADAFQHMINNDDWTLEEALLRRFNLLAGEQDYFIKFIEAIVSPDVRGTQEEIIRYVSIINDALQNANCELSIEDYVNNLPCYRLMEGKGHRELPNDIRPNTIPIFVDELPNIFPAFRLEETTWDDYGFKTSYSLSYYEDSNHMMHIGPVRIMKLGINKTYGILPSNVMSYGDDFCSLGQTVYYYDNIKEQLGEQYRGFLYAMRDAAVFSSICDEFCDTLGFKNSLIRYKDAEDALQQAVFRLAGYSFNEPLTFVFQVALPYYPEHYLNIKFEFGDIQDEDNLNRVVALIGNNGVGKTTVLSQLAECIASRNEQRFHPRRPIIRKVISASYSIFDKFFNIESSSFNYTYCGIQKRGGGLMSPEEIQARRRASLQLIKIHEREQKLYRYLRMLLTEEVAEELFDDFCHFKEEQYFLIHERLSSGQSMLMNLVIEIVANIRQNALILIDEPEIHLHPKGITTFVNIINKICREFSSICILATHSAVIIQELLSRNVIVMDRQGDGTPVVRPMRVESLGENLTTITEDVFGRNQVSPYYKKMVKRLVGEYESIEEVLNVIQNNDVPVSMPLYMLIDKYFSEK